MDLFQTDPLESGPDSPEWLGHEALHWARLGGGGAFLSESGLVLWVCGISKCREELKASEDIDRICDCDEVTGGYYAHAADYLDTWAPGQVAEKVAAYRAAPPSIRKIDDDEALGKKSRLSGRGSHWRASRWENLSESLMRAWRLFCTATVMFLPDVPYQVPVRINKKKPARQLLMHHAPIRGSRRSGKVRWLDPGIRGAVAVGRSGARNNSYRRDTAHERMKKDEIETSSSRTGERERKVQVASRQPPKSRGRAGAGGRRQATGEHGEDGKVPTSDWQLLIRYFAVHPPRIEDVIGQEMGWKHPWISTSQAGIAKVRAKQEPISIHPSCLPHGNTDTSVRTELSAHLQQTEGPAPPTTCLLSERTSEAADDLRKRFRSLAHPFINHNLNKSLTILATVTAPITRFSW
ncbi:hypothetical protein CSAL01_04500 [Colletotrichum salicis]|uniref:Uncharacterized protein n=1 Tax=Colletotrichum salicis TaxID=1209931 RepID=A0A135UAX7_9PEZI|nr:hypothetical protein CSAL01_04500 [Colletotrichum salicis]